MNPFMHWPECTLRGPLLPRHLPKQKRWNTPVLGWLVPLLICWTFGLWFVFQAIQTAAEGG